jgi:hypothetical protein
MHTPMQFHVCQGTTESWPARGITHNPTHIVASKTATPRLILPLPNKGDAFAQRGKLDSLSVSYRNSLDWWKSARIHG